MVQDFDELGIILPEYMRQFYHSETDFFEHLSVKEIRAFVELVENVMSFSR